MSNKVLRQRRNESDIEFLERAKTLADGGFVDAGYGPACQSCATFTTVLDRKAEIVPNGECYNCGHARG